MKGRPEALVPIVDDLIAKTAGVMRDLQSFRRYIEALPPEPIAVSVAVPEPERFLGTPEVLRRTSIRSRSTLWAMEREGRFVPRVKLSRNRIAYRESEINRWIQSRGAPTYPRSLSQWKKSNTGIH
jgi:predicted DNA-binding transcriptional regulator AlpA